MKITLTIAFIIITSLTSLGQTKDEKAVSAAVEALRVAMVDGNKTGLEDIAAEDLSYGHSGGKVENKAEFVEKIVSGKSDFVSIELTNQTIKITGTTAVVRHNLSAVTNDGGKPGNVNLQVLTVWQKQKGKWKLLARQAIKIAQ